MRRIAAMLVAVVSMTLPLLAADLRITVKNEPLVDGRISPMLFGNFIELLDDVVPGMWAEMLNDRSFEGITRLSDWCYYDGGLDVCDRPWDTNSSWTLDTSNVFNGTRCARITATSSRPGSLTQSGLAVKKWMTYNFSGHFRFKDSPPDVTVILKTLLPSGEWMILGSAKLPRFTLRREKYSVQLVSKGETDRAVFEVRVEGKGVIWADKLSLMPADNIFGWRKDVVDAVKETQPSLIRFGGSVCDPGGYRWKNGIGDRDLRVPFPNKVWGRLDPNDVGVDEFCQFCEVVGAAPLICLSFSDGPNNAADLVEYCNGATNTQWGKRRAANGHPAPYAVKYWQIGNEISGDDDNYVGQFHQFATLMKQADGSIEILSSFPSQKLLDRVGRDISFIAPHHYTPDLGGCENDFSNLTRMINKTPGCAQIKIAVTEWNTSGGDWGLGRAQFATLNTALRNARYLHVLMRHCDKAKIACRSNMANSFCGGIFETSPAGLLKRPSFYVMELYARHALPVPLKIERPSGGLDLFAACSEDRKKIVVFAINSDTAPTNLSADFSNWPGSVSADHAEGMCDAHDTRQPDVMNHWSVPNRIRIVPLEATEKGIVIPALSACAIEFAVK